MFHRRLPLPPPRTLPWPLKPLESVQTSLSYDEFGRMVMRIQHDVLKGLTPEIVSWWFGNIAGDTDIDGKRLNRYLAWAPAGSYSLGTRAARPSNSYFDDAVA
jgi:hypothetical protein